jgi:fermentation-respiration switch protein FrsA (DUF1100 family)
MLLLLENKFLFVPARANEFWVEPPPELNAEDVELTSADGTRLHAWWCRPDGWAPEDGAMLYSHGNAGNLSGRSKRIMNWQRTIRTAVLIYDYPGYGKSEGKPSEIAIYAAGDAGYHWLTGVQKIPPEKVIIFGESLGGAVAIDLAARHPCQAVVTAAAFSSFPDMAQKTAPWLPARWFVRNRLDNVAKVGKIKAPVFIAHGNADRLIPFSQGEKVFKAANEPKRFFPMEGHDHNDPLEIDFYTAVLEFLNEHAQ